jgi:hypothetical protein
MAGLRPMGPVSQRATIVLDDHAPMQAFVPQGSVLRDVVLADRRGQPICHQQLSKRSALEVASAIKADRCF